MGVTQERTASPFRCTVHAPQSAMPQPNLVSSQAQIVAQIPQQRHLGIAVKGALNPIHLELDQEVLLIRHGLLNL